MGVTIWVNSFIFSQVQGEARFWSESSMISFLSPPFVSRNEISNRERQISTCVSSVRLCPCLIFGFPEMTMQGHACLGRRSVGDLFPSHQFKKPLKKLLHLGVPSSTTHLNFSLHALCSIGHCNSRPPCIQSSRDGGLQSNPIPPPTSRFLQILSFGQEPSSLHFLSTCKSVASIVTCQNWKRHVIKPASSYRQLWNCDQMRCLGCIAGGKVPSIHRPSDANKDLRIFRGSLQSGDAVQTRRFFGCGDGEEGGALSKVYEERRVLGYSPVQLFDVVAAVDLYQDFVPWCQRSEILKSYPDGSFDAELEIGFRFLVESYVSHVELKRPQHIKTTVSQSTLFDHLINIWQFKSGPVPGSCNIYFLVDFKFQSPLYRQVASMFFREVVSRLVGSFSERCCLIYGPGIPIQEDAYGQRA